MSTDGQRVPISESPPRMRGKVIFCHIPVAGHGITPAYAGKKIEDAKFYIDMAGSPPRMRGKGPPTILTYMYFRITPAYAGKSHFCCAGAVRAWDHPRICGEKICVQCSQGYPIGSPPHMRGKAAIAARQAPAAMITPAYAGKRSAGLLPSIRWWDHPRICGEKAASCPSLVLPRGSPPHMRGKASAQTAEQQAGRITPAYAGKSSETFQKQRQTEDHPRICGEKTKKIP